MRLLVTGASGLLGLTLAFQASRDHEVLGLVHQRPLSEAPFTTRSMDLTQSEPVEDLFADFLPDAVVHCAAMATPDTCEERPEYAWSINAETPGRLAALAAQYGAKFVHISTEGVFDGAKGAYSETDQTNPISTYARTKLAGEIAVAQANPHALIARVIFYGWSLRGERSLGEWFFNNLSTGTPVKGFTDAIFCPLLVNDLTEILLEMIGHDLNGLYHVASRECSSKYDFGMSIAQRFGLDQTLLSPASVMDSGLKAYRPANLSLCVDKITQELGRPLPSQSEGLDRFYRLYRDGYREKIKMLGNS